MKILQVNKLYYPWIGGIESHVKSLSEGLKKSGINVKVLVCNHRFRFEIVTIEGVEVKRIPSFGIFWSMPLSPFFPFFLSSYIKNFDLVHFHLPFPLVHLFPDKLRNKRYVITWHSDIVRQRYVLNLMKPSLIKFLKRSSKIIVTSKRIIDSSELLQTFKSKIEIVPYGIDYKYYKPSIGEGEYILFVGRLVYYKGLEYLIKAMKKINSQLLIVGDGPLKPKLINMCHDLGLSSRVRFLGNVDKDRLIDIYSKSLFLVLPSMEKAETFGLVQLEAMASGKPVINTDLPTAVPEVCPNGECGITVPPKNVERLKEAINTLLYNEELRKQYGHNALQKVISEYSLEKMIKRIVNLYNSLSL